MALQANALRTGGVAAITDGQVVAVAPTMLRKQRLAVAAACGQEWGHRGQNLDALFMPTALYRQEIDPAVHATTQVAGMWPKAVWGKCFDDHFMNVARGSRRQARQG